MKLNRWLGGLLCVRVFRNIFHSWCAVTKFIHSFFLRLELLQLASANPFHLCAISLFQFPFYSINGVCTLSFWSFCGGGGGFVSCACSLLAVSGITAAPLNFLFLLCIILVWRIHSFSSGLLTLLKPFRLYETAVLFFFLSFTAYFHFCCASEWEWECLCLCEYVSIFIVASKWTKSKKNFVCCVFSK